MNEKTKDLFKTLTELNGAPGFEHEVRQFVRERITPVTDEIVTDGIGSIFGKRTGQADGPKVMVAGHMDEVAFMVTQITKNGMLRIQPLGGWWSQVLLAQRFSICGDHGIIPGIIASTPPHLLTEEVRNKPMAIKDMFIDIGADSKEEAESFGVRPGIPAVPFFPFTPMANPKKIMAKAWDNRYGVGMAIELLEETKAADHPNVLFSGATVQEEVGLRGAQTATNMIDPDVAFVVDASPANDASGDKTEFGQLGQGPLLRIKDSVMILSKEMTDYVLDTAESNQIPYQYYVGAGGTDGGVIHRSNNGIPTTVVGLPARYIHTHASIMHTDDYDAAKELLKKLVTQLDATTLATLQVK
ncbi:MULTISPECIES: M42 family metallopeptidase [unclassified Exiguobacterium]|uniref:M42 family metallopeptidase n=1 Tax=unclassified Exiguobacterium TaxID=2644629 RepID=UPI000B58CA02|nr:M42 family metallopeptidase [Exiguobacterium sp. N4-1P]ASI36100.1 peptidase M28 [Exiguobacterium sp. N4-1P]